MITIRRDTGYIDLSHPYQILLDGVMIGEIGHGETFSYEAQHGSHELQIKAVGGRSNAIEFDADGDDIRFDCGNHCRGKGMLYALFMKDGYTWLKKAP